MNLRHSLCLVTFITLLSGIAGARLTVSPSQITIGGSNQTSLLTVNCRTNTPGITQVFIIAIGKKSATGSNQALVRVTSTGVTLVDKSLEQRITTSGSLSGATNNLQFILTDLRCADAASTYFCTTSYLAGTSGNDEATVNITARTNPEEIEMFPTPERVQYDDGQLLSMRCTGRIGNVFDENNLQNLWTWEYQSIENKSASWTRYPNDQNITYETPTLAAACQYNGASTLKHTVSNLDNGRQFRCSVLSSDYSANKTVYVVGQPPPRPTTSSEPPACPTCDHENPESSLGVGVAIGVCVMLAVDAICLGLAFVFRDKLAKCISAPKNPSNAEEPVFSSSLQASATVIAPVGIQTQGVGDEYEVPVDRNDYAVLQRVAADIPNTYEKIRTYQNV